MSSSEDGTVSGSIALGSLRMNDEPSPGADVQKSLDHKLLNKIAALGRVLDVEHPVSAIVNVTVSPS